MLPSAADDEYDDDDAEVYDEDLENACINISHKL